MSRANQKPWTETEDETLRGLWSAGKTGAQIATIMGRTRNSVLGRVDRQREADPTAKKIATRIKVAAVPPKPEPVLRRAKTSGRIVTIPLVSMQNLADRDDELPVSLPHGWVKEAGYRRDLGRFIVPGDEPSRFGETAPGQCRFMLAAFDANDGKDTPCCGQPALEGKSWCADHSRLVFAKRVRVAP